MAAEEAAESSFWRRFNSNVGAWLGAVVAGGILYVPLRQSLGKGAIRLLKKAAGRFAGQNNTGRSDSFFCLCLAAWLKLQSSSGDIALEASLCRRCV